MFGAIAGGIASALAGGAMSNLFGGGQKAASGAIQGYVLMLAVFVMILLVAPCINCLDAVKKPAPVAFKVMFLLPITILYGLVMLVINLPFNALMFPTLMRPALVLFLVLWLKLVNDF